MAEWIVHLIAQGGYAGIAFLMFLETVFPPIPSEVIMSLAGVNAAKGTLSLPLVIACGTFGAMAGNVCWFVFARTLGIERFRPIVDRFGRILTLDWAEVERADHFFDRWDRWFVFFGRMVPTIRSLVSIPAGLFGMGWGPFLFWSTLGTAGWTGALATAGYLLGRNVDDVERYLGPVSTGVVVALVLWYFFRVFTWKPRQG
jgi:membrane protein DedA with SNARE-associated domain